MVVSNDNTLLDAFQRLNPCTLSIKSQPQETFNLVIEATDLLRIRNKVSELYPSKNVIVAPCLSKLYISREQQVIDADGKTSPDWFYFDTGVLAIIYSSSSKDLKIALFQQNSARLLWYMKWADFVTFQIPTSNFHILNTKSDFSEHVGFLYDNKNVADLVLNTMKYLSENLTPDSLETKNCKCDMQDIKSNKKQSIFRSWSWHARKSKHSKSFDDAETDTKPQCANRAKFEKRRYSLRDSLLRRATTGSWGRKAESSLLDKKLERRGRSATLTRSHDLETGWSQHLNDTTGYESSPESTSSRDKSSLHKNLVKFTRADSFRNAAVVKLSTSKIYDVDESDKNNNTRKTVERKSSGEHTDNRDSLRDKFRKKRLSRSQSLKLINRKCDSQILTISQNEVTENLHSPDKKQYQRATKLIKPRSSTDSLLLRGESMKSVIETGLVARYARERKQWTKNLERNCLPSTDLCVTEL